MLLILKIHEKILPDLIQMFKLKFKNKKHIAYTKVWVLPRFYTSGKVLIYLLNEQESPSIKY